MGVIGDNFGALMVGTLVGSWIYGIICVLTYNYYANYRKDPLYLKLLVGSLCLLQFFEMYVLAACVYWYLVTSWGNPPALQVVNWEWVASIAIQGWTATCVQFYYSHRTYKLVKSKLVVALTLTLSLLQLGFSLAGTGVIYNVRYFQKVVDGPYDYIAYLWFIGAAACDLILSGVQIWFLLSRNRGTVRGTNRLVRLLVVYLVSTGVLTSVADILHLVTYITLGYNFTQNFISAFAAGLYVISLHANLDVRRRARAIRAGTILVGSEDSRQLDTLHFNVGPIRPAAGGQNPSSGVDSVTDTNIKSYELQVPSRLRSNSDKSYQTTTVDDRDAQALPKVDWTASA